ncbi:hypothetical protein F8M41_020415 [Gigaspora margarita]|uniref:Uncharacterized protein n=1 Tax=Gigaspora margarita TaxID=4874 RepID=A0A8H4B1U0_GIGMA|nr:hypothetical protein F8M41_020415 [Gigaspora margarita]
MYHFAKSQLLHKSHNNSSKIGMFVFDHSTNSFIEMLDFLTEIIKPRKKGTGDNFTYYFTYIAYDIRTLRTRYEHKCSTFCDNANDVAIEPKNAFALNKRVEKFVDK